ncbi:MAG: hypothetical protein QNJ61_18550 [Desulfobacterales bacterium]|nr:hypothetical protein [Desulfobacterales bacterium]
MDTSKSDKALNTFIAEWQASPERNRDVFIRLRDALTSKNEVTLDFVPRPGVTYSLRAVHANQKSRELFVMVDVIEDDPRWLSVCFYGDMIADPEEQGDFVPEGLLGEDAVCFDIETWDETIIRYVEARIQEACDTAAKH